MKGMNYPELLALVFAVTVFWFVAFPIERFSGSMPGHLLGIAGTALITATLVYPFRKRIRGKKGKANPLNSHVYFGLTGAMLVTLHAGGGRDSTIGMLLYLSMLLAVFSGVVGRILLARIGRSLRDQKNDVEVLRAGFRRLKQDIAPGMCHKALFLEEAMYDPMDEDAEALDASDLEIEKQCAEFRQLAVAIASKEEVIEVYARTKLFFRVWNSVHIAVTFVLFAMLIVHVLTTVYYGLRWLP
jgi:hypothetical protein